MNFRGSFIKDGEASHTESNDSIEQLHEDKLITTRSISKRPNIILSRIGPKNVPRVRNVQTNYPQFRSRSPKFAVETYMKPTEMRKDIGRLGSITRENLNLLRRINKIQRSHGQTDNYSTLAGIRISRRNEMLNKLKKYEKENLNILQRIYRTKPEVPTITKIDKWKKVLITMKENANYPLKISCYTKPRLVPELSVKQKPQKIRAKVFMDIGLISGRELGRLVILLYNDIVPKSAANFVQLCTNYKKQKGSSRFESQKHLPNYGGSPFHRIFPGFFAEAGDITLGNGFGGESSERGDFEIENYKIPHAYPGMISMTPTSENKVNSLFTISFRPLPILNGERVAIGRIVKGMRVLSALENFGTKYGKPKENVIILNCGLLREN